MKKLLIFPLILLVSHASAQISTTPKVVLLMLEQVRTEIKLRPDQAKKLDQELDSMIQTLPSGVRGMGLDAAQILEVEKEVAKILEPSQMTRLRQIWMQMEGGLTLVDEGLAKELGLSVDQNTKLKGFIRDMEGEIEEMAANAAGGPIDSISVRRRTDEKMLSQLTPAQKKRWESMLGPKFEFKGPAKSSPLLLQ
jgi:hypothetical protein